MIDLNVGGTSWKGFVFKSYHKNAKQWKIFLPFGVELSAEEILEHYHKAKEYAGLVSELNQLRTTNDGRLEANYEHVLAENKMLRENQDFKLPHFTEMEARDLLKSSRLVVMLLEREVRRPQRRMAPHVAVNNSPPKMRYR